MPFVHILFKYDHSVRQREVEKNQGNGPGEIETQGEQSQHRPSIPKTAVMIERHMRMSKSPPFANSLCTPAVGRS